MKKRGRLTHNTRQVPGSMIIAAAAASPVGEEGAVLEGLAYSAALGTAVHGGAVVAAVHGRPGEQPSVGKLVGRSRGGQEAALGHGRRRDVVVVEHGARLKLDRGAEVRTEDESGERHEGTGEQGPLIFVTAISCATVLFMGQIQ